MSNAIPGIVHRILVLENAQFAPRASEPDVCHLHVAGNIHECLLANHASLRRPTPTLRSSREPVQDLLLEGVCLVDDDSGNAVEHIVCSPHFCFLVLPYRAAPERSGGDGRP